MSAEGKFWKSVESGDWSADNKTGRALADEMISKIGDNGNPTLLGAAMQEMIFFGRYGGVEAGFFQRLSERLLQTTTVEG